MVRKAKAQVTIEAGEIWNMRLKTQERARIARRAKRYARGDMSRWVRYAAQHFKPTDKDLRSM